MRYVVLGGGIAGVCCAEELCKLCPADYIILVSSDRTLKGVGNVVKYSDNLEDFEIVERDLTSLPYPNLKVQRGLATHLSTEAHEVQLDAGQSVSYDKLCICTGASPKAVADNPHVLVLRDQDTITDLAKRLPHLRRVVLVGNGGIALEVAHALSGVEVIWAVKHSHIGDAFFDLDAAAFLCTQIPNTRPPSSTDKPTTDKPNLVSKRQPDTAPLPHQTAPDSSAEPLLQWPDSSRQSTKSAEDTDDAPVHQVQTEYISGSDEQAASSGAASKSGKRHHQQGCEQHPLDADGHSFYGRQHQTRIQQGDGSMEQLPQRSRQQRRQPSSHQNADGPSQHGLSATQGPIESDRLQLPSSSATEQVNMDKSKSTVKGKQGLMRFGHAVGPQWASQLPHSSDASHVTLEYDVEITSIQSQTPPAATTAQTPSQQSAPGFGHQRSHRSSLSNTAQMTAARPNGINGQGDATSATAVGSNSHHRFVSEQGNVTSSTAQDSAAQHGEAHEQEDVSQGSSQWPVTVHLSNGKAYGADLVISAIGVEPNTGWLPDEIKRDAKDGGICIDRLMQSSVPGVYAAGDACTTAWTDKSPHWFQMRLWTQARIQGMFAAHAMAGVTDEMAFGFNFELFTHITRFCGRKVVLLGLYNGQSSEHEPEQDMVTYSRTTEGLNPTFVRVLLLRGRMQGAVLVGETELEETFEHLILDGLDLSRYGPDLLAPDVELEMMFD